MSHTLRKHRLAEQAAPTSMNPCYNSFNQCLTHSSYGHAPGEASLLSCTDEGLNRPINSTSRQAFHQKKNCRNVATMEDALKIIGMLASKWMADPVLLALPPVVVEEGLDELPVQEYLPLIALLLSSF